MAQSSRHDAWQAGDSYEAYMGRWSRKVAPLFLDWLDPQDRLDWLEVGCGTGALSAAILDKCNPRSLLAIEPSEGFLAKARDSIPDGRAQFQLGDAQALAIATMSRDVVVSALVLNFLSDRERALAEMKRVLRPGGTLGFYVWIIWAAAWGSCGLSGTRRLRSTLRLSTLPRVVAFPSVHPEHLIAFVAQAGFERVEHTAIEVDTSFQGFDNFWRPFTLGAVPAPGYCTKLSHDTRERLRARLDETLPRGADGSIPLKARAWAIRATAS